LPALPTSKDWIERSRLLIQLNRNREAEVELRQALSIDPDSADAHSLLAVSLANQAQQARMTRSEQSRILKDALSESRQAVHLGPDLPYSHYAMAWVCLRRLDFTPAIKSINEALRLAPRYAPYHTMKVRILARNNRWKEALETANKGLSIDPAQIELINWKGVALFVLRRYNEARQTIEYSLSQDPEAEMAHATRGWLLLMNKKPGEALLAFREALRIEPGYEWAAIGYKRARVAYGHSFRPYTSGIYGLAHFFTGKKAVKLIDAFKLREEEIAAANWTGGLLLITFLSGAAWLILQNMGLFMLMLWSLSLAGPVMGVFMFKLNKRRRFLATYVFLLALAGLLGLVAYFTNTQEWDILISIVLLGWVLSYVLFNRLLNKGE
jgi:tetratricopeptide (TPR) repeat protein